MERVFEVRNVGVEYVCDVCNEGTMHVCCNVVVLSQPPRFHHQCNKCGHRATLLDKYPSFRVERVQRAIEGTLHEAAI